MTDMDCTSDQQLQKLEVFNTAPMFQCTFSLYGNLTTRFVFFRLPPLMHLLLKLKLK